MGKQQTHCDQCYRFSLVQQNSSPRITTDNGNDDQNQTVNLSTEAPATLVTQRPKQFGDEKTRATCKTQRQTKGNTKKQHERQQKTLIVR